METINSATLAEEAIHLIRLLFLVGREKSLDIQGNQLYFHILYALSNHPPPGPSMSQLAEAILVSPQQLSRLVGGMEEAGLVERQHDPANRRRVYVRVLPAGLAEMNEAITEVLAWIAGKLAVFSYEEMHQLHECFAFISRLLERGFIRHSPQEAPL